VAVFSLDLVYMVGVATLSHWCENKPASTSATKGSVAPTRHSHERSCRELVPSSSIIQSHPEDNLRGLYPSDRPDLYFIIFGLLT
jgi:hypothetical protein